MTTLFFAVLIFLAATLLNVFYITGLYHRALAHGAVQLTPVSKWLVTKTGIWVTGIDPKAWVCMHRAHHLHADTALDPHSPVRFGVLGVALGQLRSYEENLRGLLKGNSSYLTLVPDLDFPVSNLNRAGLWWIPYFLHLGLAALIAVGSGVWIFGLAYFLGIMSHPVHGWMVNSLAHKYGYRNYETNDQSTNNTLVSWLVFGEGFQNNHHAHPSSPNFAKKADEIDPGYFLCLIAARLGILKLR